MQQQTVNCSDTAVYTVIIILCRELAVHQVVVPASAATTAISPPNDRSTRDATSKRKQPCFSRTVLPKH